MNKQKKIVALLFVMFFSTICLFADEISKKWLVGKWERFSHGWSSTLTIRSNGTFAWDAICRESNNYDSFDDDYDDDNYGFSTYGKWKITDGNTFYQDVTSIKTYGDFVLKGKFKDGNKPNFKIEYVSEDEFLLVGIGSFKRLE